MSDYTPTTDEVRDSLVYLNKYHAKRHGDVDLMVVGSETAAQFDRWLANVKREAAAEALEQAAKAVIEQNNDFCDWWDDERGEYTYPSNWLRERALKLREA